jgi:hypothetical protein
MDAITQKIDAAYAVTSTSLYVIRPVGPERSSAIKLESRKPSQIARFTDISEGGVVAIGRYIQVLLPDNPAITQGLWTFRTSAIVALFCDQAAAHACLQEGSRRPYDSCWIAASRATLGHLAALHPSIRLLWDQILEKAIPPQGRMLHTAP